MAFWSGKLIFLWMDKVSTSGSNQKKFYFSPMCLSKMVPTPHEKQQARNKIRVLSLCQVFWMTD